MKLNPRLRNIERQLDEKKRWLDLNVAASFTETMFEEFEEQARWMLLSCNTKEDCGADAAGRLDFDAAIRACAPVTIAIVRDLLQLRSMSAETWSERFVPRVAGVPAEDRAVLFGYAARAGERIRSRRIGLSAEVVQAAVLEPCDEPSPRH